MTGRGHIGRVKICVLHRFLGLPFSTDTCCVSQITNPAKVDKQMIPQDPMDGGTMSSTSPFTNTRESPHSLTDADSAIGASTSPDLRQDEFSDEREENFECFGESDAKEYER